jgi:hypothetical protein
MSNITKTLESLQPYVIGIRFLKTIPVVDVVLNEGWTLPEDANITRTKGDESMNYHMIHSENPNVGLDKLLEYVDKTIKINLEREKKHELLKAKVNELKEVFKKNSLDKLKRLKFTFGDEDFVGAISDIDVEIDEIIEPTIPITQKQEEYIEPPFIEEAILPTTEFLDEEGKPIAMTEEERELAEEEARAERNLKILESRKANKPANSNLAKKIELPPKRKPAIANYSGCDCDENEACDKCIDSKGY